MTMSSRPPARLPVQAGAPWRLPPPWWPAWRRHDLPGDVSAGVVVAVMLVPQSLAYAMLAGLPPHVGLMASLLPLLAYAVFGSSAVLSVGPAAITSLMVAQSLSALADVGSSAYMALSAMLAAGVGLLLMLMGVLRMGFLSQLMSRPVVQGFTVASALLIMAGQLAPILGWSRFGYNLPQMFQSVAQHVQWASDRPWMDVRFGDFAVGTSALLMLGLGPRLLTVLWRGAGCSAPALQIAVRLWPLAVLLTSTAMAGLIHQHTAWSVTQVGEVHMTLDSMGRTFAGLGELPHLPVISLLVPVVLVSLVTFVSSMSVAQTYAIKSGARVDADRELLGLGLANLGSTLLGGMAVAGGLSRTVVNEAAGAKSPLAGVITTGVLAVMLCVLMPWLAWLPRAALSAVVIMAVVGLVEFGGLRRAWRYDRAEAWAFVTTALGVLLIGFDVGILMGIAWSLGTLIWRHSQPHMAEVGRLPGTHHFRNVARHEVERLPGVLMVRVDESLDFTNIQQVEQRLCELVHGSDPIRSVLLLLSAVNHIDHSAMTALVELDDALQAQGMSLMLAEMKGPVMDRMQRGDLDQRFKGRIYLSAQHAWEDLVVR